MVDFLVLVALVTIFGGRGVVIFIFYLIIKSFWPKILEWYEQKKRMAKVIDVEPLKHKKTDKEAQFLTSLPMPKFKLSIGLIIAFVIAIIILDGFTSIPAGHVGVVYDRGRGVLAEEFSEGLQLKIPFWQVVEKMDVRTMEFTMTSTKGEGALYGDDSMNAPTADGQTVAVDATVLFHVEKTRANELFQTVGTDYIQKIVRPVTRGQIRMVISRYTAIDIYSEKRAEAELAMTEDIKKIMAEKGLVLERVLLRNITFGPEYAKAIEEKQIAQQRIQKAEYERQEAEKLKEKKIVEAQGDAESIRLRGETLRANPQVIQYEFVQKMADKISWGVLPDSILPLIDLKKFNQ